MFVLQTTGLMGRVHTHRRGKSHSIRPIAATSPSWVKQSVQEIEEMIVKYAKEGLTPSQIGIKLRDQHSIPLAKSIIKKSITETLENGGVKSDMPEDLNNILKKAVSLQKHLKTHHADKRNIRALELVEAKVHRLSVYYKKTGRIPKTWKYKAVVAQLE